MRLAKLYLLLAAAVIAGAVSCKSKPDKKAPEGKAIIKGVYTLEPGTKTFIPCGRDNQYWVADSTAQLELQYTQQVPFEQQGQPVYIEVEGDITKSATGGQVVPFDSTLVVKKLIKLSKDIPANCK